MAIEYSLRINSFSESQDDYTAIVQSKGTLYREDIIDEIAASGSTLTKPDISAVFELNDHVIIKLLKEGYNINLGTVHYMVTIRGVYNGLDDTYDKNRHQLAPRLQAGNDLKKSFLSDVNVKKVPASSNLPQPIEFTDLASKEVNSIMTPNNMGKICGYKLKVDEENENSGIFLINETNEEMKIEVLGNNSPSTLLFHIPNIPSGIYNIEVRIVVGEKIRRGKLPIFLTVT